MKKENRIKKMEENVLHKLCLCAHYKRIVLLTNDENISLLGYIKKLEIKVKDLEEK